jgi:hypothetical protein
MSKRMGFFIGCLLWAAWGVVMGAVGVSVVTTPGQFWPIWAVTFVLVLWSRIEHTVVEPEPKPKRREF